MKVKVLERFRDLKEDKIRTKGDVFEVSEKRFNDITSKGPFVEIIETKEVAKNG